MALNLDIPPLWLPWQLGRHSKLVLAAYMPLHTHACMHPRLDTHVHASLCTHTHTHTLEFSFIHFMIGIILNAVMLSLLKLLFIENGMNETNDVP